MYRVALPVLMYSMTCETPSMSWSSMGGTHGLLSSFSIDRELRKSKVLTEWRISIYTFFQIYDKISFKILLRRITLRCPDDRGLVEFLGLFYRFNEIFSLFHFTSKSSIFYYFPQCCNSTFLT